MPYIDLNNAEQLLGKEYDHTIIGAGAAGIILAIKLTEKGKNVLVVESGHFTEDDKRQVLNKTVLTGKTLTSASWGRKRAVGGTTIAWGGQSLPFMKEDFIKKDWIENSGWPILLEDIKDYYPGANTFMGVDLMNYDSDVFRHLNMKKPEFNDYLISCHFSKWAPEPNFRKLYDDQLSSNIDVLYNAVLTGIEQDDTKTITGITLQNYQQVAFNIPVKSLILATGTIEAVRTLLLNNIHDRSGMLGKGFMEHPCITTASVTNVKPYALQKQFNTHIKGGRKYSVRLTLAAEEQAKHKLPNASSGIMFYYPEDVKDPYVEVRQMISKKKGSPVEMLKFTKAYLLSSYAYLADKLIYKHKAHGKLVLMIEQEPLKSSTISLSDELDMFGLRKAHINWDISKKTWDAAVHLSQVIKSEFDRLSLGEIHLLDNIEYNNKSWADCLSDVNHHMGGTRMSETFVDGVVDKNLKVWGYTNLYVCSCSVFPTGSHSNPTLTLLALALRLVDKLTAK